MVELFVFPQLIVANKFDAVNHFKLISSLVKAGIPLRLADIFMRRCFDGTNAYQKSFL